MAYTSLEECLQDLEKTGQLLRITEEVDPNLEMASIHLRVFALGGPALLFENVKGSRFRAASNIFGTLERCKFIFRDTLDDMQTAIGIRNNPMQAIKNPFKTAGSLLPALNALPMKNPGTKPVLFEEISISDIPQIKHWPMDGGAFVTLPQVYTEDAGNPGIMRSNLGMYRIQLSGNEYEKDKEVGLHYQIHRGIGVHQAKANELGKPLKVSIFVGGPPAHTVAAVMPLPEGLSEINFAGLLAGRRFRYTYRDEYLVSTDADFVITGYVMPQEVKPEGPFGDHLGYYSLKHAFPLMHVHKVYARKNAIWPFTVVGRPPQEDTGFGNLIHEITGDAIPAEIPGLKEVHAVDAAGVHPLLLAVGSERYTPYEQNKQPAEILTIANRILGTGQLSLAKFLFITAGDITTKNIEAFFIYVLERLNFSRDIHFQTNTTIDTLDYSGTGLNAGSKVVLAAYGSPLRALCSSLPMVFEAAGLVKNAKWVMPGVIAIELQPFADYEIAQQEMEQLNRELPLQGLSETSLIVVCDDAGFTAEALNNFLWVSFTRANPSHDIHGIAPFIKHKHWGCKGPMIIDARVKPHHAPALELDSAIEKRVDKLFEPGGSLASLIKKR